MERIDKSVVDNLRSGCEDMIYKNNNGNLRERLCFLLGGEFVCVQGDTSGWWKETTINSFSSSVYWVGAA